MVKAFWDASMGEKFDSVPLSYQSVQRRILDMGERVASILSDIMQSNSYFSLCCDESTDQTDNEPTYFVCVWRRFYYKKLKRKMLASVEQFVKTPTTDSRYDIYEAVKKEALCGQSLKQNEVMETVLEVINMIQDGIRILGLASLQSNKVVQHLRDLGNELRSSVFLQQLAFLPGITGHLNELNLKLSDLVGYMNGFCSMLMLYNKALESNNLMHFS
ncbi:hypothetical protein PR048_008052, partial [Dryococelus australis]